MSAKVYVVQISGSFGSWEIHGDAYLSLKACRARCRELEADFLIENQRDVSPWKLLDISKHKFEKMDGADIKKAILELDGDDVEDYIENVYQVGGAVSFEEIELMDLILPGIQRTNQWQR